MSIQCLCTCLYTCLAGEEWDELAQPEAIAWHEHTSAAHARVALLGGLRALAVEARHAVELQTRIHAEDVHATVQVCTDACVHRMQLRTL